VNIFPRLLSSTRNQEKEKESRNGSPPNIIVVESYFISNSLLNFPYSFYLLERRQILKVFPPRGIK
jgi:hypothetical protein